MTKVSVIIPIRNPGSFAAAMAEALLAQDLSEIELIVVDSESGDGSADVFERRGARILRQSVATFQHGRTRNLAAEAATGAILVFLTQDAIPRSRDALRTLIAPIMAGEAQAAYARQVPRTGANPLEQYSRRYNYPDSSRFTSQANVASMGIRAYFFSNSCSAVNRDAFMRIGGFPTHTIMNEDMLLACRLLAAGGTIAYVAGAQVEHSHSYGLGQTLKRYFDIGVVFAQAGSELKGLRAASEGWSYVHGLFTWLISHGQYAWLPVAAAESATKWVGLFLGKRYRLFPKRAIRVMSMHREYWTARG